MALSRSRLAGLISTIVLLTLLVAFGIASLIIWLAGNWVEYKDGLQWTLKIMWGTWLVAAAAIALTRVTIFGWQFRKLRPGVGPTALAKALAAEIKPASWFKTGPTSFTITVVLVSLFGVAVLASVLIWVIGDWSDSARPLEISLKAVWGTWWVLCIITVLVRVALFNRQQRRKAAKAREEAEKNKATPPPPSPEEQKEEEQEESSEQPPETPS